MAFSGNDGPYACNGKFRMRVADEDVLMSPRELRLSFRDSESRLNPWDSRVSAKTIEDVDEPTASSASSSAVARRGASGSSMQA